MNLVREDLLYTDTHIARFTRRPIQGYRTYSEFFRETNAGYTIDTMSQKAVPTEEKTVDLEELLDILKSTN